jgi:hypothetical protein
MLRGLLLKKLTIPAFAGDLTVTPCVTVLLILP